MIEARDLMKAKAVDRCDFIVNRCRAKRVLHLGCTDWPYTETKRTNGALLHARLQSVTSSLVGVDLDAEGIACLQKLGFSDVYADNAECLAHPEVCRRSYDVIVAGEIIEHLECPGKFLRSIQSLMDEQTELILTTVNAYCLFRYFYYLLGREEIHPDHNYYFSPRVLCRLVSRCGLDVTDFCFYRVGKEIRALTPKRIVWLDDVAMALFPQASDGVIVVARRGAESGKNQ